MAVPILASLVLRSRNAGCNTSNARAAAASVSSSPDSASPDAYFSTKAFYPLFLRFVVTPYGVGWHMFSPRSSMRVALQPSDCGVAASWVYYRLYDYGYPLVHTGPTPMLCPC